MDPTGITSIPLLHIGTSGWSYKHWYHVFYPETVRPDKFLEYYSLAFSCVELNSSFYHLPRPATITGWTERTPETFRFCPKLSRFITHQKKLREAEEAVHKFFELFAPMHPRLGPVLIQLPPGILFNRDLVSHFFGHLQEYYSSYRFAVEVRHRSWITEEFFRLLHQHHFAFTIADSGKRFPYHEEVTTDIVYLRFHGHESLYASDYNDEQLGYYAEKIRNWLNEDKEVWAFFNNDFHGYAIKNATRLKELVD
jgi:uncharacterized protein YecE (DUF72 family)